MRPSKAKYRILGLLALLPTILVALLGAAPVRAQSDPQVQVIEGDIRLGEVIYYLLPELQQGDTFYAYATNISGNFNPLLALNDGYMDLAVLRTAFQSQVDTLVASGVDRIEAQERVLANAFVAVDDNSGQDSDAAIELVVPKDGDYWLIAASTLADDTFGEYELLVGLNAPQVLAGAAVPSGDVIAVLDEEASRLASSVQELTGTLTIDRPDMFFTLNDVNAGDTLYAYIEATSGDLVPLIRLTDYGGAVLRNPNEFLQQSSASFEYTFEEAAEGYRLELSSCCADTELTAGDYRLLVGINEPQVLTGGAASGGRPVLSGPVEVQVGVEIQQITDVDQIAENFGAVVQIEMRWNDPDQAFSPDDCRCRFKSYVGESYKRFIGTNPFRWPEFTIFNQQGNRWIQNQGLVQWPNGDMSYFERSSVTLQAPDFDFTAFPFDTQQFFLHIQSLFPEDFYWYVDLPGASGMGDKLGEEEWVVTQVDTTVSSEDGNSRYSLGFQAERHQSFYLFRIIIPTLLIVTVSWFVFFLKDFGKRVDVMLANLLVFVAFNFTISGELPRLGYLTFLDTFLAGTFVITAVVLLLNVVLKRLEIGGHEHLARRIDHLNIWLYPLAYLAFLVWLYANFLA